MHYILMSCKRLYNVLILIVLAMTSVSSVQATTACADFAIWPVQINQKDVRSDDSITLTLPLPEVPRTLTRPQERAAYIMEHFWDAMDFADTTACHDREFMEQNFVNFISLFPHATSVAIDTAITIFIDKAAADSALMVNISEMAGYYLGPGLSPMRNALYHIAFLEKLSLHPGLPRNERDRLAYSLTMARKESPGTLIPDFAYIDGNNARHTLYEAGRTKYIVLMFYDPECDRCTDAITELGKAGLVQDLIVSNRLDVIAIDVNPDNSLADMKLAKDWHTGHPTDINFLYSKFTLDDMPAIYLLKPDKTILVKDSSAERILMFLGKLDE